MKKDMMKKETKAAKTHSCEKCGCNIYKGQMHYAERIYSPVKYHYEWDSKSGGYTKTLREHIHSAQCDMAIREVQIRLIIQNTRKFNPPIN